MRVLLLLLVGVLGACQSTPIAMDLGTPVVSNAQGATREGVVPLRGLSRVSMHADRVLRMEPSCAQILKLAYSSNINYSEAIIGLRNRARVMQHNCDTYSSRNPLAHRRILYTYSYSSVSLHRVDTYSLQGYLFSKRTCRVNLKRTRQISYRRKQSSVLSVVTIFLV